MCDDNYDNDDYYQQDHENDYEDDEHLKADNADRYAGWAIDNRGTC